MWGQSLDQEDSPGRDHGNPSSILAWSISWIEEPSGLQSMGSQRIGHDWSNLARNMPRVHPETSLIVQGMVETPIHEARIWFLVLGSRIPHAVNPQIRTWETGGKYSSNRRCNRPRVTHAGTDFVAWAGSSRERHNAYALLCGQERIPDGTFASAS